MAAVSVGTQNANNTNAFTRNVLVKLDAAAAPSQAPWLASNYNPSDAARKPPYATYDSNLYYAAGGAVGVPGGNRTKWTQLGLDAHSLFDVDPLLRNVDPATNPRWPFGIVLAPGSPAFDLGFRNFAYGPRQNHTNEYA